MVCADQAVSMSARQVASSISHVGPSAAHAPAAWTSDVDRAEDILDVGDDVLDRTLVANVALTSNQLATSRRSELPAVASRSLGPPHDRHGVPVPPSARAISRPTPLPPPVTSATVAPLRGQPVRSSSVVRRELVGGAPNVLERDPGPLGDLEEAVRAV